MQVDLGDGELTVADAIRLQCHPVVSYTSASQATKKTSQAELDLPNVQGRELRTVSANPDWVEVIKRRYKFDTVHIPRNGNSEGATLPVRRDLSLNRVASIFVENQEAITHQYHRNHVLAPATHLAAAYVAGGGTFDGKPFLHAAREAIAASVVRPGDPTVDSLIFPDHKISSKVTTRRWSLSSSLSQPQEATLLLGEDKTHRVMTKLAPLIDAIVQDQSYMFPTTLTDVSSGVCALTQVWSQMAASRAANDPGAWINKLYASSVDGKTYHCYFKLIDEENMEISRWYNDSDNVHNTVAVMLYSLEQLYTHPDLRTLPTSQGDVSDAKSGDLMPSPSGSSFGPSFGFALWGRCGRFWNNTMRQVRKSWEYPNLPTPWCLEIDPGLSRVVVFTDPGPDSPQAVFDEFVARGSCGTVLRCRSEKKVV
ncbi:hypothetical protein B0H12DRAFT_1109150, partial [Mycena haematopus]